MKLRLFLIKKSREKKHKQFMDFCNPSKNDKVLDVGTQGVDYRDTDNFLVKNYPYHQKLTCLGIQDLSNFSKRYPNVKAVTYDGKKFPFKNGSFEYVWSNAVIEHVGNRKKQELFLSEMIRVAKKKVFFTTPNKGFPIELHTSLPFVHWLDKNKSDWFYIKAGKKFATGEYMDLLMKNDIIDLLETVKKEHRFDYKIIKNRFSGMAVTFSILVTKKEYEKQPGYKEIWSLQKIVDKSLINKKNLKVFGLSLQYGFLQKTVTSAPSLTNSGAKCSTTCSTPPDLAGIPRKPIIAIFILLIIFYFLNTII